ncbi:MAG: SDR family NAD(P)-dependent oxidoreductase, partial [Pseudomonadales bacterium]
NTVACKRFPNTTGDRPMTFTLAEKITVQRPLQEVFAYVSEFSNIEQWDPAVRSAEKLSDGLPGIGSEYCINMRAGFSLNYVIEEFEPGRRMQMAVTSRWFNAEEEIRFEQVGEDTTVRYIANFDFPKAMLALNKRFPFLMDRVGKATMSGMKQALEDRFPPPKASKLLAKADELVLPGLWRFTSLGFREAKRRFKPLSNYMGDKHVVITGPTSGIGEAMANELAQLGATLTLVARNHAKASEVASEIIERTGNPNVFIEIADLSSMAEIHALATRLVTRGEPVDVLINNAGALFNPREETSEGFEKSFALLLLGPYILTESLLPLLKKSVHARVVNVLSGGMYAANIKPSDLQYKTGEYSGSRAYARAKRGLMIATEVWADSWRRHGIAVNAMHPGWADTPGVETSLPGFYKVTRPLLRTPEQGADTAVWLAAATESAKVTGKFWLDREQHPAHMSDKTRESTAERQQLLHALRELMEHTRPASKVKPSRRARPQIA